MAKTYLHLSVNFKSGGLTPERLSEIENILNKATSWIRYIPNCWIIYTGRNAESWHERLRTAIPWLKDQQYLICEINPDNKQGWLARSAWDWINEHRE